MTRTRLEALAFVGGSALFFVFVALWVSYFDTRFIYMCMLAAALLGTTFLLGIILSLPGVKHLTEKVAKSIQRNKRRVCIGVVFLLVFAAAGMIFSENGHRFLSSYQTELFWLVFFPGIFMIPYFYAVIASRLRSGSQDRL